MRNKQLRRHQIVRGVSQTLQALEGRRLLAAVSWDGGAGTNNWTDANNWSTNALPGAADDVTINVATNPTILLNGANAVINSLTSDESLNLNSGTLSLAAASSSSAAATVTMGNATLTGAGTFTVNGPLSFITGTMTGSGMLIAKGATTIGSGGAYTTINGTRTLRIDGSATLSTANGYNTNIAAGSQILVASGGTLDVGNGSATEGTGAIVVASGGTLTRTAAGTGTLLVQVQNSGTVSAAAGTTLNLNSSVSTNGVFGGAGTIQTYGGTHTFANSSTTASVTYNHVSGTIDGAGTLTVNGPFNWTAGIIQGSGTISLRGTSQLGFGGAYIYMRDTRTIRVDAGVTTLGHTNGYSTQIASGARLIVGNGGMLDANVLNGDTRVFGDGANGTGAINIEVGGKLNRTAATGNNNIGVPVNNLGTIDVDAGYITLSGGGTNAAANTPASGAVLNLGGTWTFNDGTTMSGAGIVNLYTGAQAVTDGPAANTINVAGDGTTLQIDGATFEGAGQTNVAAGGKFSFLRGVMQGSATTTVFGTTLVGAVNGYSSIQGTHQLRIRGAGSFGLANGYDTRLTTDARIVVGSGGTLDASSTGDLQLFGYGVGNVGAVVVEAGGTLTRTAAGIEYIDVPVICQTGGTLRAASGAILSINAGSTYAAGSSFAGPGTVQLRAGTHSIDGATGVSVGGNLQLFTGTIAGTDTLTVAGFIDLYSGALAGSAKTVVTGTGNVGSGGGYLQILDTHQLRAGSGGILTSMNNGGYDTRVSANARIIVNGGGTFDFSGPNPDIFGVGGVPGTGLFVIDAGGSLIRTAAGGDTLNLPVQNSGTIAAALGSDLGIGAGSTQLAGATIAGSGNVYFNGGTHTISGTTTIAAGSHLIHQTSTIDGAGTLIAEGRIDIANSAVQTGTGTTIIRGTTSTLGASNGYTQLLGNRNIRVEGTLTTANNGGYDTRLSADARITVASGGTFDFSGGNPDIFGVGGASGTGLLVIEAGGTFTRTAAGGDSLNLPVQNAGTIRSAAGSQLGIAAGSTQLAGATIAGPGEVHFNGGTHTVSGTTTVVAGGKLLQYTSTVDGSADLIVDGTLNVLNSTVQTGSGTTILRGTTSTIGAGNGYMNVAGTRTIRVEGTATVTTNGGYDIRFASGTNLTVASGGTLVLGGSSELLAAGSGNVGTLTIQPGGTMQRAVVGTSPIALSVVNLGTVRVDAGAINFTGATNADDGAFLSSGRYLVFSGANLGFSPALTTLTADVELSGTGTASGLNVLAVNRGRLGYVNASPGATIDPAGATRFRNEGIIDLSPTSTLTLVGGMDFGGTSQPIVRSEIASAASFGKVVVTGGSLDLNSPNSTSRFDPDLVGGYDPAIGTQFAIMTAPSRLNGFDSIQGGLTPSNNVLGAYSNATTYGAVIVAGPAPAAPQILSQSYEYETRQAVTFTFNQDVSAFLSRKDYTILNLTTNQVLPQSAGTLTFNTTSNTATLVLTNQMPNGDYKLTVNASDIANSVGIPASGAPITLQWYVLAGDVTRNRVVNFDDLLLIAQAYGQTGRTFTQGNVNYSSDGLVGFDDLLILAQNYGTALSVAPTTGKDKRTWSDLIIE